MRMTMIAALSGLTLAACATMGERNGGETAERDPVWIQTEEPNLVPAGTELGIRVTEAINTKEATPNKTYRGELLQDIRARDGHVMVERGSPVTLAVVEQKTEGGAFDTPQVTLAVRTITANGRTYAVTTAGETQSGDEGIGVNERTGIYTGGGAAIGTVLGAVLGGTEGAIVGGVLGAGAGAATQILTQGDEVNVPAGAEITFRLDEAWRLRPTDTRVEEQPVS